MKICVLDGFALNPGDLSWDALRACGDCEIYERTPREEVVARAAGAEMIITNKAVVGNAEIVGLPGLRYIGVTATGYNTVSLFAAKAKGVVVTNVPGYATRSVAQHVFALLLELTQHTGAHSQAARGTTWTSARDWCFWDSPLVELHGLTMGILGYGAIGAAVGEIAAAFGMKVISTKSFRRELPPYVSEATVHGVFSRSDVVTLHCPMTPETRELVNAERLATMKPSAFLINTARGDLVDEAALAEALNAGRLAGAGLDVLSVEPPMEENPLLSARNCIITPHLAWATRAARSRLMEATVENVRAFLAGSPINVVS